MNPRPIAANKPRFGANAPQSAPVAPSPHPIKTSGQWLNEVGQNVKAILFPEPAEHSHHHHAEAPSLTPFIKALGKPFNLKQSGCFDRPDEAGGHTHHKLYEGPAIHGHGQDQAMTLWVGEKLDKPHKALQVEPGQQAVQVSLPLLKRYLAGLKQPLPWANAPQKPFHLVQSTCFDFPDGAHTHHRVYTGPTLNIQQTNLAPKAQQTAILVGQHVEKSLLTEKNVTMEPEKQTGVLVTANVFKHNPPHTH
jgi:hypothetical protein